MALPVIEIQDLSKRYHLGSIGARSLRETFDGWYRRISRRAPPSEKKDFWALRGVTFDLQAGEVIGVIGRNGAGKSTLLKILSRITEPTSGRAIIRGRVASLLEVGTGFHPELSGRENIYLNGAILGMKRSEVSRKFDEIVAFAEVERFIDTPVKRYSSGMYVRLAFAVAAHLEPDILIIDEVLAVGDTAFQRKCIGKMEAVSRTEGRTILFVSHDLSVIANLCRRIIYMKNGAIQSDGPPREIISAYTAATSILSGSIDLARPTVERRGDQQARFTGATLLDAGGEILPVVVEGQDFTLQLEIAVSAAVPLSTLDFTIVDPFNNDLFTGKLFDEIPPGTFPPGHYRFRAKFSPNFLAQGSYTVRLACFGPHFHEYDHIHHAFSLLVGPGTEAKAGFSRRPGSVRFKLAWSICNEKSA